MVEAVGFTATCEPVRLPGIHVYVFAPIAVSVVPPPLHTVGLLAVAKTVGSGATSSPTVKLPRQVPLCAVSVYMVEAPGLTVAVGPVMPPGFHV